MSSDRRREPRHVVEGLRAEIDGVDHDILDISASAVRVLRADPSARPAARVALRLVGRRDEEELDVRVGGALVRTSTVEAVYRYGCSLADWPRRLALFDTFVDLRIAALED